MIECQDVSFSYPASTLPDSERQAGGALKHISCTIEDGSFVLLCGTSGCGKTTMTRLFNGLIPHYHEGTYTGSVYLDGKDTPVSYTHLRAHETGRNLVCRLLLEKKKSAK